MKTQGGFIQQVENLKSQFSIECRPQDLLPISNPMENDVIDSHVNLLEPVIKASIDTSSLRQLALETMNLRYPEDTWLRIYTDGSQLQHQANVGAGIHSSIFSFYFPVGKHLTAYDGEIEAIHTALKQLLLHLERFTKAVILTDSRAAIESISSSDPLPSIKIETCRKIIAQQKNYSKIISLQWIPGHYQICGKKGTNIP